MQKQSAPMPSFGRSPNLPLNHPFFMYGCRPVKNFFLGYILVPDALSFLSTGRHPYRGAAGLPSPGVGVVLPPDSSQHDGTSHPRVTHEAEVSELPPCKARRRPGLGCLEVGCGDTLEEGRVPWSHPPPCPSPPPLSPPSPSVRSGPQGGGFPSGVRAGTLVGARVHWSESCPSPSPSPDDAGAARREVVLQ